MTVSTPASRTDPAAAPLAGIGTRRRAWLSGGLAVALTAGLAGCGFHMRGPLVLPFTSMRTNLSERSDLGRDLRGQLTASGVRLEPPSAPAGQPLPRVDVVMDVLTERRERVVLGMTSVGQVNEVELRVHFRFRVRTPAGRDLIPELELVQEREQSYNEALVVGKDAEELLLFRDMESDIVRQVMRRLAAIKGL